MKRRASRLLLAFAAALALHALLFLAIPSPPGEKNRTRPRPLPLRVELRELPRPERAPVAALPDAPPSPIPSRKIGSAKPPSSRTAPDSPPDAEPPSRDRSSEWHAAGIDRSGGRLTLELEHPESALPPLPDRGGDTSGLVREKSREEKLAEEKATVTRRIEGWLSDAKARRRAATGKDGYWQAVENHLGRDFTPGSDVLEQGAKAHSALGVFMQQWQQQAASYGATGNPFAGAPGAPGATRPLNDAFTELANEDRGLHGTSFSMMPQLFNLLVAGAPKAEPGPNRLIALVRITLRADGSLVAAELAGTSGNAAYDRLAVARARSVDRLQLALAPTALETLWAFETDLVQAPPVPLAGCALDGVVPQSCWMPLQKHTRSRVRLVAIF